MFCQEEDQQNRETQQPKRKVWETEEEDEFNWCITLQHVGSSDGVNDSTVGDPDEHHDDAIEDHWTQMNWNQ